MWLGQKPDCCPGFFSWSPSSACHWIHFLNLSGGEKEQGLFGNGDAQSQGHVKSVRMKQNSVGQGFVCLGQFRFCLVDVRESLKDLSSL